MANLREFLATLAKVVGFTPGLPGAPRPGRPRRTRSGVGQSTRYAQGGGVAGLYKRPRWGRKLNGGI